MKKIQFYIRFHTSFGQSLFVTGNIDALGNNHLDKAFQLQYLNEECWQGVINVPASVKHITYSYYLKNKDGTIVEEGPHDRMIDVAKEDVQHVQVFDVWNYAGELQNSFFTSPFQQVLLR